MTNAIVDELMEVLVSGFEVASKLKIYYSNIAYIQHIVKALALKY